MTWLVEIWFQRLGGKSPSKTSTQAACSITQHLHLQLSQLAKVDPRVVMRNFLQVAPLLGEQRQQESPAILN